MSSYFVASSAKNVSTVSVSFGLFLIGLIAAWATHSLATVVLVVTSGFTGLIGCLAGKHTSSARFASPSSPREPLQQSPQSSPEIHQMISMVAFFNELPFVDGAVLSAQVTRMWGLEIDNDEGKESFVGGSAPLFVIKTPHQMYAVNYQNRNYFDNLDEVLEEVTEMRVSKVLQSHKAWISIDLVSDTQGLEPHVHFAMIGRLLNQLANQDCVALLLPNRMDILPWDETIESALAAGSPLENLRPSQPPVIPINDNNPELLAAIEKAKDSFTQFVTAFENHQRDEQRDDRRQFAVKTSITVAGMTEFMWVAVTAIENGVLYGTLDNQPVSLPGLCRGERVRVPVVKIHDWFYTQNDMRCGGFTTDVINNWARTQQPLH